jgi:Flp pilus assembly protein TadD
LLGNSAEAVRVLTDAVRRAPDNAEIRLHAATALVSVGSFDAAEGHLKEAVRLSPELDSRDDVQALRARLSKRR